MPVREETKKKITELTEDLMYFSNMCDHLTKTIDILNTSLNRLKADIKQIKDESRVEKNRGRRRVSIRRLLPVESEK